MNIDVINNKKILLAVLFVPLLAVVIGYYFISNAKTSAILNDPSSIQIKKSIEEDVSENLINIDIQGAVKKPGLYKLKSGSRVADVLDLAGGLSESVNYLQVSKNLNLAAKLDDAVKLYIPFDWENDEIVQNTKISTYPLPKEVKEVSSDADTPVDDTDGASSTKINVNTATDAVLDGLPGIGPVYLEKIISNRPYKTFTEFTTKSGIPVATLDKFKDLITF